MLYYVVCGEEWRVVGRSGEHLFERTFVRIFFEFFVFSSRGKNVFIFFSFRSNALLLPSTSHQNPLKSYQNPLNPYNKKTNKTQQNITLFSLPYPTSLLLPYITKKYKNKNQKISPQHKIYPPKTSY